MNNINKELLANYKMALKTKISTMNELKLKLEMLLREIRFIEQEIKKLEEE